MDHPAPLARRLASCSHRSGPFPPLRYRQAISLTPPRAPSRWLGHRLRRCRRRPVCFLYSVPLTHLVLIWLAPPLNPLHPLATCLASMPFSPPRLYPTAKSSCLEFISVPTALACLQSLS